MSEDPLLPKDALKAVGVAVSVSESADLDRLGLGETHFRLALGEIARCVFVAGGHLAYGGHLDPKGYTAFLIEELHKYSRRDKPMRVCLAWTEHRRMTLSGLAAESDELGLFGEIACLDLDGNRIDPVEGRGEEAVMEFDADTRSRSLSVMRRYMGKITQARIVIGGKRAGFQGNLPGVVEEALLALEAGQPVYLAGGFGGATLDMAKVLKLNDGSWLPELAHAAPSDERLTSGLAHLSEWAGRVPDNGLSAEENARLASSHRPSEIATLVSLGLGRKFAPSSAR